jgi:hypothetical protein
MTVLQCDKYNDRQQSGVILDLRSRSYPKKEGFQQKVFRGRRCEPSKEMEGGNEHFQQKEQQRLRSPKELLGGQEYWRLGSKQDLRGAWRETEERRGHSFRGHSFRGLVPTIQKQRLAFGESLLSHRHQVKHNCVLLHFVPKTSLWSSFYDYPHFIDGEC